MRMRRTLRGIAAATAVVFSLQMLAPPVVLANDETVPGGSSPNPPSPPNGKQGPANNSSDENDKVRGATDPVEIQRGDFVLTRQDVFLPGRGLSVDVTFTYRSQSAYNSPFGYGWDMSYNRKVRKFSNGNLMVLRGSNRKDEFIFSASNGYAAPAGIYDTLAQNADGTYTLASKHGEKEFYDMNGNLVRMEDRNGNALTFAYDPAGLLPITGGSDYFVGQTTGVIAREYRLTRITDTIGRTIDFTYNAEGRLDAVAYEGRTIRYGYDANSTGDLVSVTTPATAQFPSGSTTTYTYANHNLESITDAKGQIYLTNVYDAANDRVVNQTYGAGTSTLIYSQDSSGNSTTEVTDRNGFKTFFIFDTAGHIIRQEEFTDGSPAGEPASFVTDYEYNAAGERTRALFPRGNAVEMTYDVKGNPLEIRRKKIGVAKGVNDPTDIVTAFTYDPTFNFVKTATDPRGNTTTYTYDSKGNLTQLKAPNLKLTTFTYNGFGQLDTVTDPNGIVTKYEYDSVTGYLTKVTAGFGTPNAAATTFTHDSVGNVISTTDANGRAATFTYNALNQLVQATAPAPFSFETHYTYDANGNLVQTDRQAKAGTPGARPPTGTVSQTDDWQSTLYGYTALDQLASVTDDLGQVTAFAYDATGNRRAITDAKNQTTTYVYDERNLLTSVTDAATPAGITAYAYDANGNLLSVADANGNVTTYAYDDFDRLKRTTYPDGTFEAYTYDAAFNLTQVQTPKGESIQFTYNSLNRLTRKVTPQETTTYAYDNGGRLTTVADPDASISHSYDSLNRVTQVTTTSPGLTPTIVRYTYDPVGNRTRLTYPDNAFVTYTYDALNRLNAIKDSSGLVLADSAYDALSRRSGLTLVNGTATTYQFDAVNRLTDLTTTDSAVRTLTKASYTYDPIGNRKMLTDLAGTHDYIYDVLSQVTGVDYPAGLAFADTVFTLDPVGNRTQVTAGAAATSYTSNALNQYTAVGSASLAYDPNGNLTSDGTATYTYDSENRLRGLSPQGTVPVSYDYDPFGRRISKTVSGVTTRYLYDGDDLIAETNATGGITAKYLYGAGIDEPLKGLSPQGTVPEWYYHSDGLGSVTALTNASGVVVERYSYDIYGTPKITDGSGNARTTSALGNRFLFTGREWDSETSLYHYRARAYSPSLGRFLQRDPKGYVDGPNPYTYAGNGPATFTDPFGLWYFDINVSWGSKGGGRRGGRSGIRGGGLTGGIAIGPEGIYPYGGGGLVYPPGLSVAISWSPQNPTPGWTVGGQGVTPWGIGGQYGYSFGEGGGQFGEVGVGYPAGFSLTEYYVSEPWKWPWRRDWWPWKKDKKK